MSDRPTRWARARHDWPGFAWRDVGLGAIAAAITVAVLALLDFPWDTLVEVLVSAGVLVAVWLLYPLVQLWWAWQQAPMRLLAEDIAALRADVAKLLERTPLRRRTPHALDSAD